MESSNTCSTCHGTGKTGPAFVDYANGTGELVSDTKCRTCAGAGRVSAEMSRRMKVCSDARDRRVRAGIGIRDGAARLGFTPAKLSAMEHGMADPEPIMRAWMDCAEAEGE